MRDEGCRCRERIPWRSVTGSSALRPASVGRPSQAVGHRSTLRPFRFATIRACRGRAMIELMNKHVCFPMCCPVRQMFARILPALLGLASLVRRGALGPCQTRNILRCQALQRPPFADMRSAQKLRETFHKVVHFVSRAALDS
jgi:hypothetical protein